MTHQHQQDCSTQDALLAHYADIYKSSAKLKNRIKFYQFIERPEEYLQKSKDWPDVQWDISFTKHGSHKKMWVDEVVSKATLGVTVIDSRNPEQVVRDLDALVAQNGKPDAAILPRLNSFESGAVRAWCRINNIKAAKRTPNRAPVQCMGTFEHEAAQ